MTFRSVLFFLACLVLGAQGAAPAQEAGGRGARVVFAGDQADYYPYHFLDKGEPKGFDVELFQRMARKEGWSTAFRFED
ncbi:transporter substrate-binding domain-containing protein [Massilia niastensis]|uniref:transporter substrate-binding domain-containing protein n=1 Tax=Massilia niastensis TaxID=544911 RepID=UPI00037EDB10